MIRLVNRLRQKFVKKKSFKKILIANRGEIAVRIIRACQELGIRTVAVHSLADKDSLHAKLADESVCIGPGPSSKSYLHIPAVMSAAEITGVDAIHPGYGFLSENEEFARICEQYEIKFIGPTADQIGTLGNKVRARAVAVAAKIALLPGSKGVIRGKEEALSLAEEVGYPLIIKAAAGGGGRGMKVVQEESQLIRLFHMAQVEAQASFGNPDCFMEKYLETPRHVEVQIVADEHGNSTFLGERDCSLQRRHQKIIEEAPCPVLTDRQKSDVGEIALKLIRSVGYQSLGTVEFLFDGKNFYFMEMNTRAQVEHPVTEMVMGVDLIKEQILIAQGERLSFIQKPFLPRGHAIECRINAEDPHTFAPWPGKITDFHQPGGPGIRVDTMVYAGYTVPSLYDSLLAKVIAHGSTRLEAIQRMIRALKEMKIEGIRTNIEFHLRLLSDEKFIAGDVSTRFIEQFIKQAGPLQR
ncbi:MAG: acetyl-CoA carboxylase biotin carboxylase subunit [Oligoflexales bacterium]|nr:acetyl-CoA carboxylase biotin carboxylase subunit [Oligoflexales bacterium]